MSDPTMIILYVDNPQTSADFYARLLGKPPVEASGGFAMLAMNDSTKLGLWARATVAPPATVPGGGEIVFALPDSDAVDAAHRTWRDAGLEIAQAPTDMEFGRTCVALDPDRHRLRAFAPART